MQNKKCKSQNSSGLATICNLQFAVFIVPCLAILAAGCDRMSPAGRTSAINAKASTGAQRVETIVAEPQDLDRRIERTATVEAFETADLYAKVGGYLEKINVDIGDRVIENQPLAELYVPEMLKTLQQRQAAVDQAKADVDQAREAIRQAAAEVTSAA